MHACMYRCMDAWVDRCIDAWRDTDTDMVTDTDIDRYRYIDRQTDMVMFNYGCWYVLIIWTEYCNREDLPQQYMAPSNSGLI